MTRSPFLLAATAAILTLAACDDGYNGQSYNGSGSGQMSNTQAGALTGALLGGALGATSGGDERITKAAAGAIIGGLIGGAVGNQLDKQAQELRRDLDTNGVSVVRQGDRLVVTMPQDVLFATDSAAVRPDLQQDLYTLAGSLNRYPNTTVEVVGHTDSDGEAAYNQRLSESRARAVANILVNAGVPQARVVSYGRGEEQPVASNYTPEGKAQNRRVEFIIRANQ
ncbi:OmpA family protein [Rhodobacter maris]|uniref:Outer membrane protein OmpA-like peptidoglycan-associated protein n=1 Tax=Rhodobacter maris TaxID=446682 RepID=A0A285S4Z2_9RHOB|nr:OmpA family protein [Rhodobacter maris]SOC02250.1 outer membrane protein OmpA-like peptidoglycan-associated protein [Rhodobacter maris]